VPNFTATNLCKAKERKIFSQWKNKKEDEINTKEKEKERSKKKQVDFLGHQ